MLNIIIRIAGIVMTILCAAISSAFGIGAAAGIAIALCAWLIVRPLSTLLWWVGAVFVISILMDIITHPYVLIATIALVVIFDIVRQYLVRTNTQSRAISGAIAIVCIIVFSSTLEFAGMHQISWSGKEFLWYVFYSAMLLAVMEWIFRRMERTIALFVYGSDLRRHI